VADRGRGKQYIEANPRAANLIFWLGPGDTFVQALESAAMTRHPLVDLRRKRILYRATHRGTKESDAIIGGYFTATVADIPDNKLDEADALLDESDPDLMDWVMGKKPVPDRWQGTLFDGVLAYYGTLIKRN